MVYVIAIIIPLGFTAYLIIWVTHLFPVHSYLMRLFVLLVQSIVVPTGTRSMNTSASPQNSKTKLKNAIKEYGSTVLVVHISLSLMSLGGFYLLVSSGYNVVELLKYLNLEVSSIANIMSSNAGNFLIAYAIHKVFAPLRIAVTLSATPFIVRYLRQTGILKGNVIKKSDGCGKSLGNKS